MTEFIISDNARYQQTMAVTDAQSTNDSSSTNRSVDHWDMVCELTLETCIEVLRGSECSEAVGVCELCKYSDFARVLELNTIRH